MASDPKGITPTKGWSSPHYRVKGRPTKSCFQNACLQNLKGRVDVVNVRPERHTDASTLQLLTEDSHLVNPTKIFGKETVEHNSMKAMMIETTTLTLKGPYLKEIHEFTLLLVKHPIITDRVEVEMLEQCVCIKGPFELVKEVYDGLPKCLTRAISNGDWPSPDELSRIASDVIETTDDELPPNLTTGIGASSGTSLHSMDGLDPLFITLMEKNNLLEGFNLKFSQDRTQVFAADENDHESIKVFSDLYSESKSSQVKEDFLLPRTTNCSWLVNHLQFKFPSVVFCPRQDGSLLGLSLNKPVLLSVRDFLNSPKLHHPIVSSHGEPCVVVQLSHKLTLTIKKGNLVKEEVSAIVNAANEQLRHGAGVAWAIDKASQCKVQKASEKALKQLHPPKVPTGQALLTSAGGSLKCHAVIHAVGPDAAVFTPEQCTALLRQACEHSLRLAEKDKMTSVAFPPISSGIFGMDKTVVAQVMIDTICQYKYEPTSTLIDVRIVIIDNETLQPFLNYGALVASIQAFVPTSNSSHSPQQPSAHDISPRQNRPVIGDQMVRDSHQVLVPLAKSHRKLIVKTGNIIYANAEIKVVAISSPAGFKVGHNASLDLALDGLLQKTVNRRYQNGMPDKYDAFTVHCPPNSKVNCRFLVVANILDRDLGRRSDAPKVLQQIMHSVCREADTLEMPTAAIAPGTFDCGGFPKDSILPAFCKMLNEYNFTNDEFLTEVSVFASSDDDFSVLVQSAERTVGQPLLRFKDDTPTASASTPDSAHLPQQPSADDKSLQAAQTRSSLPHQNRVVVDDQMSHDSNQVLVPLAKSHRKLAVSKGNILYGNAEIKVVAISSPEGFNVGNNASLDRALDGLLQQTVDRRYQIRKPDKYDVFTVHCPPNSKANCRFLVVANILDYNLGRRSNAPKFLQQILHSVCKEADTLEMPTAAIAPGSFDCGGFPKDSILPAFIKMLNEYNFTNDEFLTEVSVLAMSDDDFSVLVQSAERTVGQPLLQPRDHPPRPPSQPVEDNPATGSSIVGQVFSAFSYWNPFRSGSSNDKVQNEPPSRHTKSIPSTPVSLSTSQPAHCSSITMGSKCTLSVKLGNIVEEVVDAYVNPTNGNLDLISGVSSAINAASQGAIKRECTALMSRRGGPVPPGCVAATELGRQKRKWIIHVNVYDIEETSIQGCSQLLLKSIANVLEVAENKHLSSVALTPFFPRTSGLELTTEMVAHYFIDALVHSSFTEQSSMKELRLFVGDEQSFITFQKELQTVSSMSTATLPHPAGQSHASQVQPSRTEPNSRNVVQSPSTEPDVFEIPTQSSRRRLVVKKSRFLNELADIKIVAICSEDQKHPGAKNLDKMLNGALVEFITRRYQHRKPSQFDVFTVHCPPEATLQCRFLVVANILDRKLGQGADSHKYLNQILHNVCREADTLEMPTVAIASGTFDIGGFPRESILPAFVRMITQYNFTNDDFLTDVKFLTTSDDAFASMCAVVKRSFGTPEGKLDARSPLSPVGSPTHSAHCSPSSYHGRDVPNVQVVVGDIVTFVADAVVVPVSSALDLKGIVSEAVNNATHGQLHLKVKNLKIKDGDVVPYKRSMFVTSQWNIKAPHLYLLCRSKNSQIDTLKKGLASALGEATSHNLKSIAFPIPFLSKKGSKATTADFAKALKDVVTHNHQATNPAIVVTVVVSKDEPSAVFKSLQESFRNPVTTSSDSIDTAV